MANAHGDFIWYELVSPDPDGARSFYEAVVGWTIEARPSGEMDYRMISSGEGNAAGLMRLTDEMAAGGARPAWLGYVGVDDVDAMVGSISDGGGTIHMGPWDIPNVGRMAFVADPQGAPFYVMRGSSGETSTAFSYDTPRGGHCAWNELSTSDPAAALHFYGQRFGWVKDGDMDMGPLGKYEFLRHGDKGMIGAVMPMMPGVPMPVWTYYFRVPDIDAAATAIRDNGGTVVMEPMEIPGGDFSMNAIDPQGAHFALVGARRAA